MINYHEQPAFPPQLLQDNLGRLVAPVSGLSKKEFAALYLLPTFLKMAKEIKLSDNGKPITPIQAAIKTSNDLFSEIEKSNKNESNNLQIIE